MVYMGAIDVKAKEYMSDRARFADAFNFFIHGGKYEIKPDNLSPVDTSSAIALLHNENAKMA